MSEPKIKLSLVEQISMISTLAKTFFIVLIGIVTRPWKSAQHGQSFKAYIGRLAARTLLPSLSLRQQKYLIPDFTAEEAYAAFCKQKSLKKDVVDFPKGGKGFWIGDASCADVIVYIPGGGYVLPATDGHFEFCRRLSQQRSQQTNGPVSVLMIAYSLVPHAVYPVPVEQSIWAMKHVLENLGKDPSRLIVAGDSAGATLALDVVAHSTHPFPGVPQYQTKQVPARFQGLLLISPWADFRTSAYGSYTAHEMYDVVNVELLDMWSRKYISASAPNVWSMPALAEANWWSGLQVDSILLTAGNDECMRDVAVRLAKTLQTSVPNVQLVIGQNECHVDAIASINFGELTKETETMTAMFKWMDGRMS